MLTTKLDTLKAAAARQDWQGALRIAAKFPQLGEHKAAILRGHEAHKNADFARQLGRNPAADIEAGIGALCVRYGINRDGTMCTEPKRYGAKNNCIRAARKALGAEAQPGVDFTLDQSAEGWAWAAIEATPAVVEARAGTCRPQGRPNQLAGCHRKAPRHARGGRCQGLRPPLGRRAGRCGCRHAAGGARFQQAHAQRRPEVARRGPGARRS